jgi:hypothetical protein
MLSLSLYRQQDMSRMNAHHASAAQKAPSAPRARAKPRITAGPKEMLRRHIA